MNIDFLDVSSLYKSHNSITSGLAIGLTSVQSASSERIPLSIQHFRNLIPSVKLQLMSPDKKDVADVFN